MALGLLAVFFFVLSPFESPQIEQPSESDWDQIRLPEHINAIDYKLNFTTDLELESFEGTNQISLDITKETRFIVCHQVNLTVKVLSLIRDSDKETFSLVKIIDKPHFQFLIFVFNKSLQPGYYKLDLHYAGVLSRSLAGYYISEYFNDKNTLQKIATSQFEATDARKAFPCLDEPNQKATFEIIMQLDSSMHALSNMPVAQIKPLGTKNEYIFQKTVKMSTYLLAFIISDFESISSKTINGVLVRVWTAPNRTNLGEYALKVAVPMLEFYQQTFGIDFPLPKMDLIAIPDFGAGAMENWGLVTFRDTALLYDPVGSTAANKQRVASVVAHELAHQWFGNLVTMKWWKDLWLNEGFAEFMEYKATNYAEPNWGMLEQFIPMELVRCLHADESYYTHQIAVSVDDPSEISSLFDDISYGKGSSILRMLESWMDGKYGEGVFFQKLHNYLSLHSYGNAETYQLWDSLSTSDQNISVFMNTWTDQPGFPYLTFGELQNTKISVSQSRFIFSSLVNVENDEALKKQQWSIPLSYVIYTNSTGKVVQHIRGFTEITTLGDVSVDFGQIDSENSIFLANTLQTGVYRSNYDEKTYFYLIDWLNNDLEILPAVERSGLISDVFSMTFAGILKNPTISLELSKLLAKDADILVWNTALKDLESLKNVFALDPLYGALTEYLTILIEKVIVSIGWKETLSEKHPRLHGRALLRGALLSEAIRNNHEPSVETALAYFNDIKGGKYPELSPDVLPAVYDAGVIYGDLEDYMFVQKKFLASKFAPEKAILLHAMASSRTPYLQAKTLAFAISGAVRAQDIQSTILLVAYLSPVGHISVWIFLMDNWKKLTAIFKDQGFSRFPDLIQGVTSSFTKHYLIEEADRLFVQKSDPSFEVPPGCSLAVKKGLETARQLLAWRDLYSEQVGEWLQNELKNKQK